MRSLQMGLCLISLSLGMSVTLEIPRPVDPLGPPSFKLQVFEPEVVWGRSSGGRSGGGSFKRRPSTRGPISPPKTQPRFPSRVTPRPRLDSPLRDRSGGPIFVPIPTQPRLQPQAPLNGSPLESTPHRSQSGNTSNALLITLVVLFLGGGGFGLLLWFLIKNQTPTDPFAEINNDTVTVSQLQVALVANAGSIQQELSTLALNADTHTNDGLVHLLQESALILLRHSESWTHVHAESQTVPNLDIAQKVFSQMAIAERSKLSAETLVNVGGTVSPQKTIFLDPEEGPAAYIVVTLLVGTAHDRPLFAEIRTEAALSQALQEIAALPPDYLLVLELIWSPQAASDSLTYDELLTEYTDLMQI